MAFGNLSFDFQPFLPFSLLLNFWINFNYLRKLFMEIFGFLPEIVNQGDWAGPCPESSSQSSWETTLKPFSGLSLRPPLSGSFQPWQLFRIAQKHFQNYWSSDAIPAKVLREVRAWAVYLLTALKRCWHAARTGRLPGNNNVDARLHAWCLHTILGVYQNLVIIVWVWYFENAGWNQLLIGVRICSGVMLEVSGDQMSFLGILLPSVRVVWRNKLAAHQNTLKSSTPLETCFKHCFTL